MKKYLLLLLSLLFLVSCRQIEVGNIKSFTVKSFSGRSIMVDMQFDINNPKKLPVSIKNAEFMLIIGGKTLGTAVLQKEVSIAANKRDSYYFPLELKLSDNIGSYFSILKILKKNEEPIVLKGWLNAQSGIITRKFNFEKEIGKDEIRFP